MKWDKTMQRKSRLRVVILSTPLDKLSKEPPAERKRNDSFECQRIIPIPFGYEIRTPLATVHG